MPNEKDAKAISLGHVEYTAREFNALATAVSQKLDAFLEWLNSLPAHTSTELFQPDPDQDPDGDGLSALGLQIDRGKGGWNLYYTHGSFVEPSSNVVHDVNPDQWTPLEDAPLYVRCAAISLLPELVKKMHAEQTRLIRRLQSANAALDSLDKLRTGKAGA